MLNPSESHKRPRWIFALGVLMVVVSLASCSKREGKTDEKSAGGSVVQKTFASPEAAGTALFQAAKSGDQNELVAIFGPQGKDLVYSGDPVKDKNVMEAFVTAYGRMNRWSKNNDGTEILYIGTDNFPFPIPLAKNASGQWAFNTAAGKDEVLARRIGDGELTAIGVLSELANAQREYFSQFHQYAQKIVSDEGKQNGLYWTIAEGQRPSPLGQLAQVAKALGYSRSEKPQPFNGYYFKILTQQGDKAKGGARDYMANGKMTGGFAIVAWPATYRDSGIMTFIVGEDGKIYQKDMGDKTSDTASAITAYNPSDGWALVLAPDQARAGAAK